jgi:hypothetical protein
VGPAPLIGRRPGVARVAAGLQGVGQGGQAVGQAGQRPDTLLQVDRRLQVADGVVEPPQPDRQQAEVMRHRPAGGDSAAPDHQPVVVGPKRVVQRRRGGRVPGRGGHHGQVGHRT